MTPTPLSASVRDKHIQLEKARCSARENGHGERTEFVWKIAARSGGEKADEFRPPGTVSSEGSDGSIVSRACLMNGDWGELED